MASGSEAGFNFSMRDRIRRFLARHRRHWLIGKIGRNLGYYYQGFENQDYSPATNGEKFVIESLAGVHPEAVIFDVGAHHGEWAGLASAAAPRARIHAFEPVPSTFAKLRNASMGLGRVAVHQLGFAEHEGTIEFSVVPEREELSSGLPGLLGDFHRLNHEVIRCPVLTVDRFCAENGIERIDLLKLDVEGLEPAVLKGALRMLAEKRIRMVQFEYGQINLKARFFLGDFHALLGGYGMKLGKIYPNYVDFREYHFTDDTLAGPNFLAVDSREHELIRRLEK
jgi:FkbM family methyltransferase